jgi:hypothetical protein
MMSNEEWVARQQWMVGLAWREYDARLVYPGTKFYRPDDPYGDFVGTTTVSEPAAEAPPTPVDHVYKPPKNMAGEVIQSEQDSAVGIDQAIGEWGLK